MLSQNKIKCYECDREFDKYEGNFYVYKGNLNGYFGKCIDCHKKYCKEIYIKRKSKEENEHIKNLAKIAERKLKNDIKQSKKYLDVIESMKGKMLRYGAQQDYFHENIKIRKENLWMGSREREYYIVNIKDV